MGHIFLFAFRFPHQILLLLASENPDRTQTEANNKKQKKKEAPTIYYASYVFLPSSFESLLLVASVIHGIQLLFLFNYYRSFT